jgi:hypothetical protein
VSANRQPFDAVSAIADVQKQIGAAVVGLMNPYPFSMLQYFTVPVGICLIPHRSIVT